MDKRYSTIIFVPHARAKFRKLKVSHRLLFSLVSVVTSSLCLSTFFSVQYFTSLSQTHELSKLRVENREALMPLLLEVLKTRTAGEWLESLEAAGVPCCLVRRVDEVFEAPEGKQMVERLGGVPLLASPLRLSETPASIRRPPPRLGEHTEEILG